MFSTFISLKRNIFQHRSDGIKLFIRFLESLLCHKYVAYMRSKSDELLQHGKKQCIKRTKNDLQSQKAKGRKCQPLACVVVYICIHFHLDFVFCVVLEFFLLSQTESWVLPFLCFFSLLLFVEPQNVTTLLKQANENRKTMRIDLIRFLFFFCSTICGLDCNADKATTIRYRARSFCFCSWRLFFCHRFRIFVMKFRHEAHKDNRQSNVDCKFWFPFECTERFLDSLSE